MSDQASGNRWRIRKHVRAALAISFLIIYLLPVYWMVATSFRPAREISATSVSLWTSSPTLANYASVLSDDRFAIWARNSFILATATMFISVLVSTLAGYCLARSRLRIVRWLGRPFLLAYIVPSVMIVVPVFLLFARLGWHNTFHALILTYTALTVPFSTWILRAYFLSLPTELEDAALVDGCTRLGALFRIMLPLAAPGIVTAALFSFVLGWNEYLFAFVFTFTEDRRPLSVALQRQLALSIGAESSDQGFASIGDLFAMCVLVALPVFLIFLVLQRWLVRGLAAGAVKG